VRTVAERALAGDALNIDTMQAKRREWARAGEAIREAVGFSLVVCESCPSLYTHHAANRFMFCCTPFLWYVCVICTISSGLI
jgi:hypothetical protein